MWIGLSSIGLVSLALAGGAQAPAAEKAEWTVLAYLSGDGDLEDAALGYLRELGAVPGAEQVHLIAQIDRGPGHSQEPGDFTDTQRIVFATRSEGGRRERVSAGPQGEVNTGDPQTLAEFLVWGLSEFPAERLLVLLMGHGSGVRELTGEPGETVPASGVGYDATSGGDSLTVRETGEVCRRVAEARGGRAISLLAVDACFSATAELGCEVAPYVECLTGSPGLIYEPGIPWDEVLGSLVSNAAMESRELGKLVVEVARAHWSVADMPGAAYVAADLGPAPRLQVALNALCEELGSQMSEVAPLITLARSQAPISGLHSEMLELRALLHALAAAGEAQGFPEVALKADEAGRIADSMVLGVYAEDGAEGQPACRGWAVFFPPNLTAFPADYLATGGFARDAGWGSLLAKYLTHLGGLVTRTGDAGTPPDI